MFWVQILPPPPPPTPHFFIFLILYNTFLFYSWFTSPIPHITPTPNIAFSSTLTRAPPTLPPHQTPSATDPPPPHRTPPPQKKNNFFFEFSQKLQFFVHINSDPQPDPTPPLTPPLTPATPPPKKKFFF